MQRIWTGTSETPVAAWVGLGVIAGLVVVVLAVVGSTYPTALQPLVLGTILVAISLPVLMRQARLEQSDRLLWFLLAALVLKLIASIVRYQIAFGLYGGAADAGGYHQAGVTISEAFRHGNFVTGLPSLVGTNFLRFFTGVVYTVIGPNIIGGFLVFSWLGYWGMFLFYRAFKIAVPEGRASSYAWLVFFLPSMIFWPSSIGKEAWMIFALGIAVFGVSKILSNSTVSGLLITALGLWLAALVRPHIAGIVALALAGAYLLRRTRPELRQLGPIVKGFSLAVLVVLAAILVVRTDRFLQQEGIQTTAGASGVSSAVQQRTGEGGSSYAPTSIVKSPLRAPVGMFSVLFRPLPFEAHNLQAMATALEGAFLLLFSLVRIRWLVAALKSARRQPYVAFALLFTGLFVVGFSSVANFGLLARERVQLLPMYLVLFTVPRPDTRSKEEEETMDEPRGNWLPDPPSESPQPPRQGRPWPGNESDQPDASAMMLQLEALEQRTRDLEAELRAVRSAPPSEATETRPTSSEDISDRFTELARRAFSEEFEQVRREADREAEEILAHARAEAERLSSEARERAEADTAEAERMIEEAGARVQAVRADAERLDRQARARAEHLLAASASRSKELAEALRDLLARVDSTIADLEAGAEAVANEEGSERAGDLVMMRHKKARHSDEDEYEEEAEPEKRPFGGDDRGPESAG